MHITACPQTLDPVRRDAYRHVSGVLCRDAPLGEKLPEHLRERFALLDILVFHDAQGISLLVLAYHDAILGVRADWELVLVTRIRYFPVELCVVHLPASEISPGNSTRH